MNFAGIFLISFFGFAIVFVIIFFAVIFPRMQNMKKRQKQQDDEYKLKKEQNKTLIEKEKLERELLKQRLVREAELEAEKYKSKFCEFCGTRIPVGSYSCPSCGSRKN